jgi:hypothetical protein
VPKRSSSSTNIGPGAREPGSAGLYLYEPRRGQSVVAFAGGCHVPERSTPHAGPRSKNERSPRASKNALERPVQADKSAAPSSQCANPLRGVRGQLNHQFMPIKGELALWRAFLGEEIDAILRDED